MLGNRRRSVHDMDETTIPATDEKAILSAMTPVFISLAVVALVGSLAILIAPSFAARRLCGAILAAGTDLSYAQTLLRSSAVCGLATSTVLLTWRVVAGRLSAAFLRQWFLWGSVVLYIAGSLSYWWYVNDDAAITFTYARNLAHGDGLIYNVGDAPVEGYSNPLWVLILAAANLCGANIVWAAKILGIVFGTACLSLMGLALLRNHPITWLALPLAAGNASLMVWYNSGLENALHGLLLIGVVLLLRDPERLRSRRLISLVTVLVLLVLCRPEGALFAFGVGVYLGTRAFRRGESVYPALATWVVPGMALATLTVFRYWYFGDVLPNTFYVKATHTNPLRMLNPFSGGWTYVREAAEGCGWTIAVVPVLLLCTRTARSSQLLSGALAVLAAQLFFVVSVGGDWMAEFRFIAPIVPIVSIVIALGLARLWELLRQALRWGTRCFVVCLIPALLIAGSQVRRLILFEQHPTTPMRVVAAIGEYFVQLAERAGIESPSLLYHDAGGSSYVAGIHVIDLAGLCDRTIAKHRHDRDVMRRYLFYERCPTFIYSAKTFADRVGLETFPEFQSDYLPLPPAPSPALDGYIRRIRRDVYSKVFPNDE